MPQSHRSQTTLLLHASLPSDPAHRRLVAKLPFCRAGASSRAGRRPGAGLPALAGRQA